MVTITCYAHELVQRSFSVKEAEFFRGPQFYIDASELRMSQWPQRIDIIQPDRSTREYRYEHAIFTVPENELMYVVYRNEELSEEVIVYND